MCAPTMKILLFIYQYLHVIFILIITYIFSFFFDFFFERANTAILILFDFIEVIYLLYRKCLFFKLCHFILFKME